ncbi:MAG: hypothetical protein WA613_16570 [Candidatus Acidiferrales bacterium]
MDNIKLAQHRLGIFLAMKKAIQDKMGGGNALETALINELAQHVGQAKTSAVAADVEKFGEDRNNILIASLAINVDETTWCKVLEQAAAVAMSASAANEIPKVDVRTMAQELREISAQRRNNENGEAALKAPYHLFFFSAVDLAERSRFFDIMKQEDGFTLAETGTTAPRLGACVESEYEVAGAGGFHHVHRNYGKYRTDTARSAMEFFAKANSLTQLTDIAETHNQMEAGPTWATIFQKLGCPPSTFSFKESKSFEGQAKERRCAIETSEEFSSPDNPEKESRVASDHVQIEGDVGPQLLAFIYEQMKIDPEWSVREERSLTWWGHRLAQRIWAETVIMEDGDEIVRVQAETDVLRNVSTAAHATQSLSILNRNANLSAYVWNPETKKVSLRSSAYFHSQNFPWLSVFFLSAVSLQAAEAHLQPDALAKLVGGEVDESAHPTNGFREQKDEMLDVIPLLYAPWGKNPSQFTREDFHTAMELDPKPWLMANEGEKGLTAEFRFPGCIPPTALLTVDNEIGHPLFGSGLFILLRLPLTLRGANVDSLASQLNVAELRNPTRTHFMGSWCVDSPRNVKLAQLGLLLMGESLPVGVLEKGAKETLSFCSFIPSVCHRPGLLENIVYSMGCRTMWANEYLASEEGVPAEFGPRHSGAFQEQSGQHLSLRKRLLDRALRHMTKKPN